MVFGLFGSSTPSGTAPAPGGGAASALGGMGGAVASGMAGGVGMSMGNRAVDAVLGPKQTEVVHKDASAPTAVGSPVASPVAPAAPHVPVTVCKGEVEGLEQCLFQAGAVDACKDQFDSLKACQAKST